jgi:multiple sugar transport system permease protein/putative aldouronate transport system permease protein
MRRQKKSERNRLGGSLAGSVLVHGILGFLALTVLLPFLQELAKSFSSPSEANAGRVLLWPRGFTFGNYYYFYRDHFDRLMRSLGVSTFLTIFGSTWSVAFTALMAWPLALPRKEFRGGPIVMRVVIFCLIFYAPLVPYFLAIKSYGLIDTMWAMILPHTILPFHLIVLRTFFRAIPEDLRNACKIDGVSDFGTFRYMVLPLSKAALTSIFILTAVIMWNLYLHPMLFLTNPKRYPIQLFAQSIFQSGGDAGSGFARDPFAESQSIKSALVILSTLPVVLLYIPLQRFFVKGVMLGSLKE